MTALKLFCLMGLATKIKQLHPILVQATNEFSKELSAKATFCDLGIWKPGQFITDDIC
jgi:hypothetical protein